MRYDSLSPRMILARLSNLPDTSALAASVRQEPRGWGADRHLQATTVDALQNNTWVTAAVGTGKKGRRPKPIQRPGKKTRTVVSVADIVQRKPEGGH